MIAGRYSLDREIGRGGMGAVWLGRDEVLGRPVALKQIGLLPGADGTDLARAEREARLSAQLNHPHVVAVFDVVTDAETDRRWLVMEYVEGTTLAQLTRQHGRLSPDDAAPLLWQAADALDAAHAAGIVHRDVKPSNILVDRHGRVKLTDFGIARIATDATLTHTGLITGSPAYLAPEVARGERGDESSDVWSLGATIYSVLAGRPPYEVGDNVLSTLYQIVNDEPPQLADAGWMAPLLDATLVKDPSRRWSMAQVRAFLGGATDVAHAEELTETQVLRAVPAPVTQEPPRPRPRRRPRAAVVGAVAVVVALVIAGILYAVLSGGDPGTNGTAKPSETPSSKNTPTAEAEPTVEGMESFIGDYVAAVSDDPATSWQMLTPKFQRESGGFEAYRDFWEGATNGRVLDISADPQDLSVSYRARFDNFRNSPNPTVLDLVFEDGKYLINGERTVGFEPAD